MKKPMLITSHLVIFAFGVGAAFIIGKDPEGRSGSSDPNARTPGGSSAFSSTAGSGNEANVGPRARRDQRADNSVSLWKGSPQKVLGKINSIHDTYERQRALMDFLDKLAPDQFADVADEFRKLHHYGNTGTEMELLFQTWAKADPLSALDYIDANPETARNRGEVLETWASGDPSAAEKWALDKHDGKGANPYMASVIKGIAATDLTKAFSLTEMMPVSRERGQAIDAMAKALLMSGKENAFAYPETIQDPQLKGGFIMMIAENLNRVDPQSAADWVASMSDGTMQDRASGRIAERLARVDMEKATEFVSSLKPEARANAAAATVTQMSQSDIAGTARWVSSLAGTPGYDKVVESFIWSCDERAPEQSAAWIQGISDQGQQMRIYNRMLGSWARKDAAAVSAWVKENNVPDNIRSRFSK